MAKHQIREHPEIGTPRTLYFYMDLILKAIEKALPEVLNGEKYWDGFLNDEVFSLLNDNLRLGNSGDFRGLDSSEILGKTVDVLTRVKNQRDNFFKTRSHLRTDPKIEISPFLIFREPGWEIKSTKLEEFFETVKIFQSRIPEKFKNLFAYSVTILATDFFDEGDFQVWITSRRNLEILFEGILYAIEGIDEEKLSTVYSELFDDRSFTKDGLYTQSANFSNKLRGDHGEKIFWEKYYETEEFYPNLAFGLVALGEKAGLEDLNMAVLASIYGLDY